MFAWCRRADVNILRLENRTLVLAQTVTALASFVEMRAGASFDQMSVWMRLCLDGQYQCA
jgi:hypothetical protein